MGFCSRPNPPNLQNWVYFGKFGQKSTQFAPIWVFFATNWYSDGSQNHAFRGIEMVDFPKSKFEPPRTKFFEDPYSQGTDPGGIDQISRSSTLWHSFILLLESNKV